IGRARCVVVTGPSGAGKSCLLREVVRHVRERGERAAVIACDPASPYTGGAFLGDRVRWTQLGEDPGVFVRSVAHREKGGVLPSVVWSMVDLIDAAGYPWVFVESVGAGQMDGLAVPRPMTRLLVLTPDWGDDMQMLKAGLLERGDLYVVNKSDLPGSARWARALAENLGFEAQGEPRVLTVAASTGEGVEALMKALEKPPRADARK
ncbi:MAG: methylmalonyl Co-A mutase-associated GTPase MeaB, partial [Planctomycetota bacterium]|nr:methylmalonyl Co-A mutase-associated GTPase MeaB [Planctomycetota bacterium]